MSREQIAQRANSPFLTLAMLAGFVWLGWYSYTHRGHGYEQSAVDTLNIMADGGQVMLWKPARPTPKDGWTKAKLDKAYGELFADNGAGQ